MFIMFCSIYVQHPLYIVVETGTFLTHLEVIAKYKDSPFQGIGQPVFLFPWILIMELEALQQHGDKELMECVKGAMELLRNAILSNHPRVLFETYHEVNMHQVFNPVPSQPVFPITIAYMCDIYIMQVNEVLDGGGSNNAFIHCCKNYQHKIKLRDGCVVLLSDDFRTHCTAVSARVRCLSRKVNTTTKYLWSPNVHTWRFAAVIYMAMCVLQLSYRHIRMIQVCVQTMHLS